MSEQLKDVKTALDNTVYQNKEFDEHLQEATLNRMINREPKLTFGKRKLMPVLAIAIVFFLSFLLFNQYETKNEITSVSPKLGAETEGKEVQNFLLITDINNDAASVILFNVNSEEDEISYVNIPHRISYENSITEFVFKGGTLVENDFEDLLDIEINEKIIVDPLELGERVEELGGVVVNNDFSFSVFSEGEITLRTKQEVVDFVTMKKEDPRGVYGRNIRIFSVFKELVNHNIFDLPIQLNEAFDTVRYLEADNYFQQSIVNEKWTGLLNEEELKKLKNEFNMK